MLTLMATLTVTRRLSGSCFITKGAPSLNIWLPSSLSSLALWLTAGPTWCFSDVAGTVPCGDGDPVAYWADRSGTGNNLTQSTLSLRPILRLVSGRWYVRGDGVDDYLTLAVPFTVGNGSVAAFKVSKRNGNTTYAGGSSNGAFEWYNNGTEQAERQSQAALGSATVSPGTTLYRQTGIIWNASTTTVTFYLDGATNGANNAGAQNFAVATSQIGTDGASPTHGIGLNEDVGEFVISRAVPSAADLVSLQHYLRTAWNV